VFILVLLAGCHSNISSTPKNDGYHLVWSDEFDGTDIDYANWTHQVGADWHNNELQAYTDDEENSYVAGGKLVIVGMKKDYRHRTFTSARLRTKGKQDFLYGRIEARIKLPAGDGMWPAFWMMPTDYAYGGWPMSGEIDILEARNRPMKVFGNLHFGGRRPDNSSTGPSAYSDGTDLSQAYHTYAIEWEPKEIRWYCDENLYKTATNWWTGAKEDNGTFPAPFDKEFHIILNLAIGGDYVDCFDPNCITADLPQKMYVDYVRVYQK
jgi:beta-glucanase (GH16 family)